MPRIVDTDGQGYKVIDPAFTKPLAVFEYLVDAQLFAVAEDHALLLRLAAEGLLRWTPSMYDRNKGQVSFGGRDYPSELDVFNCPMLTPALRSAIEAT